MEPRVSYVLVGLFVLVLGGAFVVSALWLVGVGPTGDFRTYAIYPPESVAGIAEESAVKYQGVDVGKVTEVGIDPLDPRRVRVLIGVRPQVPITTDTTARIASQGLTGLVYYIELRGGEPGSPALAATPGSEYPVIRSELSEMTQLQRTGTAMLEELRDAAADLRGTLARLGPLLGEGQHLTVGTVIDEAGQAAAALAEAARTLNGQLGRLGPVLDDLSAAAGHLPGLAERAGAAVDSTGQAAMAVARVAQQLDDLVARSGAGLRGLTEDGIPELVALLGDLRGLAARLSRLATDLGEDPNLLIFGRQRRPGPGER